MPCAIPETAFAVNKSTIAFLFRNFVIFHHKYSNLTLIKKQTTNSTKDLFLKAASFCAYQERTQNEVRDKLVKLGATIDEADELICQLIAENYLNEERFAQVYSGGKFRIKKWGRIKISQQLKTKGISQRNINTGLLEIEEEDYLKTLEELINKKSSELKESNTYIKNNKIALYVIRKGYEPDLVWNIIKNSAP